MCSMRGKGNQPTRKKTGEELGGPSRKERSEIVREKKSGNVSERALSREEKRGGRTKTEGSGTRGGEKSNHSQGTDGREDAERGRGEGLMQSLSIRG